jgi:uncharacterized protein YigE (DUF2233 family)
MAALVGWLMGCAVAAPPAAQPTPILPPATSAVHPSPTPLILIEDETPATQPLATVTPLPDSGWQPLQPGLEQRTILLFDAGGRQIESLYLLRLEPAYFQFGVAYRPGEAQSLRAWQAETGALLVVNGGYFTAENIATGRVVVAGEASGVGYGDFAGMLAVTAAGPEVRWLRERPYDAAEPLQYALQSFPVLVRPGGEGGFPDEDGIRARRTVIGQDQNGRVLFIIAPWGSFTLHALSVMLAASDLQLHIALNLDGGASTGLLLAEPVTEIPAFIPLPVVVTVHSR